MKLSGEKSKAVVLGATTREIVPIVSTVDDSFVLPLAMMLYSLLEHSGHRYAYQVFIIDSGVSDPAKQAVNQALGCHDVPITWLPIAGDSFRDFPLADRARQQMYHVLSIGDLLPGDCGKVLFLDADTLILDDVEQLWEVDLQGKLIAAVQDMAVPTVSSPMGLARFRQLSLPAEHPYFNAGVMVMDLLQWRKQETGAKILHYLRVNHDQIALQQQDGLNAVLARSWLALDLRWNVIASIAGRRFFKARQLDKNEYLRAVDSPAILHYAGHFKPWEIETAGRFAAIYEQYLHRQECMPWKHHASLRNRFMAFYDHRLRRYLYSLEHRWWSRRHRPQRHGHQYGYRQ